MQRVGERLPGVKPKLSEAIRKKITVVPRERGAPEDGKERPAARPFLCHHGGLAQLLSGKDTEGGEKLLVCMLRGSFQNEQGVVPFRISGSAS